MFRGTVKWWEAKPNTDKTYKNQFHLPENDWEGLKTTCVQLDIGPPLMVNWQLSKKGIYWTVSDECNARSCVQLTEVRIFFFIKFSVDQILVFAGSRTFKRSSVYFLKLLHKDISSKIPWELRFWPWLNLYIRSVLCMMGIFWDYGPTNSVGVW